MDFADFKKLANHYTGAGAGNPTGKAAVVPEPDTLRLVAIATATLLAVAWWRRGRAGHADYNMSGLCAGLLRVLVGRLKPFRLKARRDWGEEPRGRAVIR